MTLREEIEQIIIDNHSYGESILTSDKLTKKILKLFEKKLDEIWKESLLNDIGDGDDGKITEYEEMIRGDVRRKLWDKMEEEILK